MFMRDLKESFCRHGRLTALASMCAIIATGATTTLAVDDDWEEDCDYAPTCDVEGVENHYGEYVMYLPECGHDERSQPGHRCDSGAFCVWVDLPCPGEREMKVNFKINGGLIETRFLTDHSNRQKAFYEIPNFDNYVAGQSINVRIYVRDEESDESVRCDFRIEVICGQPPHCYFGGREITLGDDHHSMAWYDVKPGDILPQIEVCASSGCYERARVSLISRPPFMDPIGHRKGGMGERVCIETNADDVVEGGFAEGTYWAKFECKDVHSGLTRILKVAYHYTDPEPEPEPEPCDDLPECEILESSIVLVNIGETRIFTVCASTPCDDCDLSIDLSSGPAFVTLYEADVPGDDDATCNAYMIAPVDGDSGNHEAFFKITDCNDNVGECSIFINVPDPMPILACTENEDQDPNDTFADASIIDAGECADGFGVNLYGVLDTPVVMNGDVDFFRIVNLIPGETYEATIVAGLNGENGFTDTMLGWLVAEGVATAKDDNSGPLAGYSKITFTADENGVATLAITGHGDDDFDGMMDASMPYAEYGFGGYMLSIRAEAGDVMPLEDQADLNADGVIDTGDLGILLGLFGISSN